MRAAKRSEGGMVSVVVTMIMMIVITLIVIGITEVTRSNQREQLNQQLNTQAYYAAESGLNQAVKFFQANPAAAINTTAPASCTSFITNAAPTGLGGTVGGAAGTNILSNANNVSYTCLMVNSTPASLQKAPLTQDSNAVWHVRDAAGNNFSQLEFQWKSSNTTQFTGANNTCAATGLPAYKDWKCAFGILRVDLVDVHGTVATSQDAGLEAVARTIYMVPTFTTGGGAVAPPASQNLTASPGQVINVTCSATLCDLKLNVSGSNDYFARLTMIYQDSDSVTLTGSDVSGAAKFSGGQAIIDVTGRAQDELRRVQARIPLNLTGTPIPNFAVQTTADLCKLLSVGPGLNTLDGGCP